jgi:class 3 adenylate cyclase
MKILVLCLICLFLSITNLCSKENITFNSKNQTLEITNESLNLKFDLKNEFFRYTIIDSIYFKRLNDSIPYLYFYSLQNFENEFYSRSNFKLKDKYKNNLIISKLTLSNLTNESIHLILFTENNHQFNKKIQILIYEKYKLLNKFSILPNYKKSLFLNKDYQIPIDILQNQVINVYLISKNYDNYLSLQSSDLNAKELNNYILNSTILLFPFFILIIILIFGFVLKETIYWYYGLYLFTLGLLFLGLTEIYWVVIDEKISYNLDYFVRFYMSGSLNFACSILFLNEYLDIKNTYKKWSKYFTIVSISSLIVYIVFLIENPNVLYFLNSISSNLSNFVIALKGIMYFIMFANLVFSAFVIYYFAIKLYRKNNKNAIYVIIGWSYIIIAFIICIFGMIAMVFFDNNKILYYIQTTTSLHYLVIVSSFFEMFLFLFAIAKKTRQSQIDLSNKESERLLQIQEKELTEKLLFNVLPISIANRLKSQNTIADSFNNVSIIFIDIVGFTKISSTTPPQELVEMLNDIFIKFDNLTDKFHLEKIKTIGDSYMAASGIPIETNDHAIRAAKMAYEIKETMSNYIMTNGNKIEFRIGIDCGPIVAGVIGNKKFIYDIWGDPVNTASRMESTGVPGEIHITERFKNELDIENFNFEVIKLNEINIKGKGIMNTYLLHL